MPENSDSGTNVPITTPMEAQGLHDKLLELMPDRPHDRAACALCIVASVNKEGVVDPKGGSTDVSDKTFTEDEVKAAIAAATMPLTQKVQELESSLGQTETEQLVSQAKAEAETKLAEAQAEKDALALQVQAEKDRADAAEKLITDAGEVEAKAKLADERLAQVAEVAKFPDEYLVANRDRIVAMEAAAFEGWLEDLKVVAAKPPESGDNGNGQGKPDAGLPNGTVMTAAAGDAGNGGSARPKSVLRELLATRGGPDLRIPEGV